MIRCLAPPISLLLVLSLHGLLGCATVSPFNQDFIRVHTPRFEILSSFGEEAALELGRSLEFHHAGTLRALGLRERDDRPIRVRILAFDDRGFSKDFSLRGEDALFIPRPDRPLIVLRTSADWRTRASEDIRHRYAHWLIRQLSPVRRPLWLEEGMAQYASTIAVRDDGIRIGAPPFGHVQRILEWKKNDFADVLDARDLSDRSVKQRADFDARAWALVHWLSQLERQRRGGDTALAEVLKTLDRVPGRDPVLALLGLDSRGLARVVNDYVEARKFRVETVRPAGWDEAKLRARPVTRARARTALAELALTLGRPDVAREYFERALADDPGFVRAIVGLATETSGRIEEVEALAARARGGSVNFDSETLVRLGLFYARAGRPAEGPSYDAISDTVVSDEGRVERRHESARWFFSRALEREPGSVSARLGLARLERSLRSEGGRMGALHWIGEARRLDPGALSIDVLEARLRAAECQTSGARALLREVISRGHWEPLEDEARALLASLTEGCQGTFRASTRP